MAAAAVVVLYGARLNDATETVTRSSPVGRCALHSPGSPREYGPALYEVSIATKDSPRRGTMGITILCTGAGPLAPTLKLALPYLASRGPIPRGVYRIVPADTVFEADPGAIAWAQATRHPADVIPFVGVAGEINLESTADSVLTGAYHIALAYAGTDSTALRELVLAGYFEATPVR